MEKTLTSTLKFIKHPEYVGKYVGGYRNIAVSVFPEGNTRNEQDYVIYGKRETSGISYLVHNYFSNSFSITGW